MLLCKDKLSFDRRWDICQGINLTLYPNFSTHTPFSLLSVPGSQPSTLPCAEQGVLPSVSPGTQGAARECQTMFKAAFMK